MSNISILGGASGVATVADANSSLKVATRGPGSDILDASNLFYSSQDLLGTTIAASLAANTTLFAMRNPPASTTRYLFSKIVVTIVPITLGATTLVPGTLGIQRFSTVLPSGGNAINSPAEINQGNLSIALDGNASNTGLTTTNTVFGNIVDSFLIPIFITPGTMRYYHVTDFDFPLILRPGDGWCLRTQVAMPATQTWTFSVYTYFRSF